jgi:hypothetical protein
MWPALDPAGHWVPRTKPTCLLHTWRPYRQRPFTLVLHLHQHQSSRNMHLQYLAKNTPHCQSLITLGSDHPPVLEPHMALSAPAAMLRARKRRRSTPASRAVPPDATPWRSTTLRLGGHKSAGPLHGTGSPHGAAADLHRRSSRPLRPARLLLQNLLHPPRAPPSSSASLAAHRGLLVACLFARCLVLR